MAAPALPVTAAIVLARGLAAGCAASAGNAVPAAAGTAPAAPVPARGAGMRDWAGE